MTTSVERATRAPPEPHAEVHPYPTDPQPEPLPPTSVDYNGGSGQTAATRGSMAEPIDVYVEAATQVLLAQGSAGGGAAHEPAAAAGRAYETLFESLAPVLGEAGIHALFARSLKLAKAEMPFLAEVSVLAQPPGGNAQLGPQLVSCLSKLEPAVATEAAIRLFATFFGLMSNFIGDQLVQQIVKSAFSAPNAAGPKERSK
jgi:hypothetical protein